MRTPVEFTIVRLVAESLRLEFPAEFWARLEQRRDEGALDERVTALGSAIGIGFLSSTVRGPDALEALLDSGTPVVLYAPGERSRAVLLSVRSADTRGRALACVEVGDFPGDGTRELTGTTAERAAEIRALLGDAPSALAPLLMMATASADVARNDGLRRPSEGTPPVTAEPSAFSRLATLLRGDRRDIVIVFFYAALAGLFALSLPLSVGAIVGLVQGGLILQPVLILIGYVVVGTLISGGLQVLQLGVVERIQQRVFARMALEFSFRIPRIRYDIAMSHDLPETMNRLFEAITIQKSLAKFLLDTSQALLTVIAGLVLLTFYHPYFSLFGLLLLLILGGILWVTGPRGLATSLVESKYKYRALHWLEEQARAFHAFKFGGRSSLGIRRMDEILEGYLVYRRKHFRILVGQTISIVVFRALIVGGFLILGSQLVISRQISLGQFVASEFVVVTVLLGVEKLILSMSAIYDVLTSAEKAGHVSDLPLDQPGGAALPTSRRGMALDMRGLTFRYAPETRAILRDVTLRIAPGERIAITGVEGAGATTLLRLAAGLFDSYTGTLLMDGIPLQTLDRTILREHVGQYMSATDLFDGTIYENVAVGRPGIDVAAARRAIDAVGLTREIEEMPDGMETLIEHGGQRLPNYVAIKLLFAQAIAGSPRLLVIDDLFQNLHVNDRRALLQLLLDDTRPWTVVVISHDRNVLAAMDRVIVLDEGAVIRDAPMLDLTDVPVMQEILGSSAFARAAEVN